MRGLDSGSGGPGATTPRFVHGTPTSPGAMHETGVRCSAVRAEPEQQFAASPPSGEAAAREQGLDPGVPTTEVAVGLDWVLRAADAQQA